MDCPASTVHGGPHVMVTVGGRFAAAGGGAGAAGGGGGGGGGNKAPRDARVIADSELEVDEIARWIAVRLKT